MILDNLIVIEDNFAFNKLSFHSGRSDASSSVP